MESEHLSRSNEVARVADQCVVWCRGDVVGELLACTHISSKTRESFGWLRTSFPDFASDMESSCSSPSLSREEGDETSVDNKGDVGPCSRGKSLRSTPKSRRGKKTSKRDASCCLGVQACSRLIQKRQVVADRHIPLLGSDPRGRGARAQRQQAAEELKNADHKHVRIHISLHVREKR